MSLDFSKIERRTTQPTKLIGFSGPPRSGKDSIATATALILTDMGKSVQLLACSTPMREVVYALLGVPYTMEHYELHKDDPQEMFGGASIRQEMIRLSEDHIKPRLGPDFWARSLLGRVYDPAPDVLIVTDCGFDSEPETFTKRFGFDNVVYAQIVRPGCDFSSDSRSYVGTPGRSTSIINDNDIETAARRLYGRLTNIFGWDFG